MLGKLEKAAATGVKALAVVGLIALLFLALLTLADGLGRWLFNAPIDGVRDIGGLVIAIAVSCCLPMGQLERGHITVRIVEKLGRRAGQAAEALASILVAVVLGLMAWQFFLYAHKMSHANETTWVLLIPIAPFWYGVDAIVWCAALVQLIVVASDVARLFQSRTSASA